MDSTLQPLLRRLRAWLRAAATDSDTADSDTADSDTATLNRAETRALLDELGRLQQSSDRLRKQNRKLRRREPNGSESDEHAGEEAET